MDYKSDGKLPELLSSDDGDQWASTQSVPEEAGRTGFVIT